jgi:ArsR family transcriptional regulator, zinc-responsive transcriptional repressor
MNKENKRCGPVRLSMEFLDHVAKMLKLLAHPHRLKIIEILEGTEGRPVQEIAELLDLPSSATSQHLNLMQRVGLVKGERKGRRMIYRISDARSVSILHCIRSKQEV